MSKTPIPPEYMSVAELAKRMGKGQQWVLTELRKDSLRANKQFPFAIATQGHTGGWTYRIHRKRFERWSEGGDIDLERLAELVASKLASKVLEAQYETRY